jgi:hypothetical protein
MSSKQSISFFIVFAYFIAKKSYKTVSYLKIICNALKKQKSISKAPLMRQKTGKIHLGQ